MGRSGWFLDRKEGEAAVLPGSSGCPDSRLHPALSLPKAEHSHGHQAPTELQGCARDLMERTVRGAAQRSPPPREGCCRRARGEWGMPPPREGCRRRARAGRRMRRRRRGGWVLGGRGPGRGVRAVVWRHHLQARAPRPPLCARGLQQPP